VLHKNIVEEYVLGQIVGAETLPGNMGIPNIWQLEKKGNGSNTDSLVMMRKPKMVLIKTMVAMGSPRLHEGHDAAKEGAASSVRFQCEKSEEL